MRPVKSTRYVITSSSDSDSEIEQNNPAKREFHSPNKDPKTGLEPSQSKEELELIRRLERREKRRTPKVYMKLGFTPFTLHSRDAFPPTRSYKRSVGIDLKSPINEKLRPGETKSIDLQVSIELRNNTFLKLHSRSSMVLRGIICDGGVIDPDFTDSIKVILTNTSKHTQFITRGDKIVQGIVTPTRILPLMDTATFFGQKYPTLDSPPCTDTPKSGKDCFNEEFFKKLDSREKSRSKRSRVNESDRRKTRRREMSDDEEHMETRGNRHFGSSGR